MANSVNMNLPIPGVGITESPDWANNVDSCLTIIDGHDHSAGSGVQINPAGLNINSDLTFNANNATGLRTARFNAQNAALALSDDLRCLYAVGDNLYYNDGLGNQIAITANGAVAGTPGSIANLVSPASASYVALSTTFVFQSDSATAADIDGRNFIFRNTAANSKGLTLSPPSAMGSNYSLVLPPLPVSQKIMTLDSSGNITAPYTVDGTTLAITTNVIGIAAGGVNTTQIADSAVTTAKIADGAVTPAKRSALNIISSSSCGTFTSSSTSPVNITNLHCTIATTGRPIMIFLSPAATGAHGFFSSSGTIEVDILRDGSAIASLLMTGVVPISSVQMVDTSGGASTYVYSVQARGGGAAWSVDSGRLVVYEL